MCNFPQFEHLLIPRSFVPTLRWSKRAGHNRAQILYYIAENMELQKDSLAECLETMTGQPKGQGHKEVELALERLFFWAAYCDKYGGSVQVGMSWGSGLVCGHFSAFVTK